MWRGSQGRERGRGYEAGVCLTRAGACKEASMAARPWGQRGQGRRIRPYFALNAVRRKRFFSE